MSVEEVEMVALLAERRWQDIRITAKAHGLRFNTRLSKAEGLAWLYEQLMGARHLHRALARLADDEQAPLRALQAAVGSLPRWEFEALYGEIRVWRPWRTWLPPHIWRYPATPAEKLWYLGLVEITEGARYEMVSLPGEVAALLPPLPLPQRAIWQGDDDEDNRADSPSTGATRGGASTAAHPRAALTRDIAVLLGVLLREDVRPAHGRWLPLRALRGVNALLPTPEDLTDVRSERQAGRTRFLHYVCEAAGLVALQGDALLPTAAAWRWLALPPAARWAWLWDAVTRDVTGRGERLWDTYHLPETDAALWNALTAQLATLPPDVPHTRRSLYPALAPYVPSRHDLLRVIPALLFGPLAWLGAVVPGKRRFAVPREVFPAQEYASLSPDPAALWLDLPRNPSLVPLVEVLSFATADDAGLRVDAEAVRRAVALGYDADGVAGLLGDLCGARLPQAAAAQVQAWAQHAGRLTLRWLPVLTAADPETLAAVRSDWRLRPLLGAHLSPRHTVVDALQTDELCRKLARRGYPVTEGRSRDVPPPRSPATDAYLYLAARVYQGVGRHVTPDVRLPGAVTAALAAGLPPTERDALDTAAAHLLESLTHPVSPAASGVVEREIDPDVARAVQAALAAGGAVTIVYRSPTYGTAVRTVEPQTIYDSGGATYIEAWCHRDSDTRTFRLDRVLAVVDTGAA